jgi:hypothetical protein
VAGHDRRLPMLNWPAYRQLTGTDRRGLGAVVRTSARNPVYTVGPQRQRLAEAQRAESFGPTDP